MAYDINCAAAYSGRPAYVLHLYVRRDAVSGNNSSYAYSLYEANEGGGTAWSSNATPWSSNVGGWTAGGSANQDFRSVSTITIYNGGTGWIGHDANGYLTIGVSASHQGDSPIGGASLACNFATDRIAQVPGAPTNLWGTSNPDQIGPTSMRYRFSGTTDGGSAILEWQAQRATDAAFTQNVQTVSSGGTTVFTGLNPGTTYYFRARGRNGVGWGAWGAQVNAATLSVDPPALVVAPNVTGFSAVLTMTPPSTLPTPDGYRIERRVQGTTAPVTSVDTTSNPYTAMGLTAGTTYEWRAAVMQGSFVSNFSPWVAATQPAPNTNPGDYFDGATAAKTDTTYAWNGTANNSTSRTVGKAVTGWAVGTTVSGGSAVIYRQTGGRSQAFAARVAVLNDATAAGLRAGTSQGATGRADVAPGGIYWGAVYVQLPARAQRLAAMIQWLDAAGNFLSNSAPGDAVLVPADGSSWTRIAVRAQAPAGAEWAAVVVMDVAGTGWALWRSGDVMVLDDAMITVGELYPYFDGNTPSSGQYLYEWLGAANASASSRTTLPQDSVDPFADPDCPPLPAPPQPPSIPDDCIEEVGVWRRYWAIVAAQNVSRWLAEVPTITLSAGAQAARQVRVRLYENPDGLAPADFPASSWVSEQIISYMPPNSVYVLDGVSEQLRGSVDGGATWRELNHLLYGTGGKPASWPLLECGLAYLISFDVPIDALDGNLSTQVSLTRRF